MKSPSYLSYFKYNYYCYYDDYNSSDHHNYFYGQCFYRYLITLSLLLLIYEVNSVTCQTNEIEIDNCFGLTNNNNNKHDFKKLLQSFAYHRAYYYKTKPDGLELVTKFNPLSSCIYGVILPHEKSFHHLNIHIMDTYLQVIKSTSDKHELINKHQVKLSILQNINDGMTDNTVYLATIYMQLSENNKTNMLLQISEFKSLVSPVYFIIEHDLPIEVDGLIHVHLRLLVTPVYLCRKYEGMLLPVDKDLTRYQGEQQLPLEKDKTTIGELFNCMQAKNKSLLGNLFKPYFCIKSALMCDQYSNCPQLLFSYSGHNFKTLDEHPAYCRKVVVFRMKDITLQTIFFSLLSISLILMTLSFALRKQFLNLLDRMCNRRRRSTELTTNESDNVGNITETGDGNQPQHHHHRPITIIVNHANIMRNNTLSVLYNQNVSPTNFYEPPPSYNEAVKQSNMSKQQMLDRDSPVDMTTSVESCSDACQLPRRLKPNSLSRKIFSPYYPEETSATTSSVCLKRSRTSPPNYIHCFMSDLLSEASNLYSSNKNEDEGNER
ncbi:unnamed protein product [Trichobilharzia szidati]|nr:unnamed protein product [Trichobilharzia szidati]